MKRSTTRWAAALALALLAAWPWCAAPADDATNANRLTAEEAKAGWKLLFDGQSLAGWHNFKKDGVRLAVLREDDGPTGFVDMVQNLLCIPLQIS